MLVQNSIGLSLTLGNGCSASYTAQITPTPSLTYTPTTTYTPSNTFTPTITPTPWATASKTRTPVPPTSTISDTPTLSLTPTSTNTPIIPTPRLTTTLAATATPGEIDYHYDSLGRLLEADYADGSNYHYTYDKVGNRKTETTMAGSTTYVYDDANRLVSVIGVSYTWDDNGNLLFNGINQYTYDSANRSISVTGPSGTVSYAYDGLGDRLQETVNGVTTTFTMDLASSLTQVLDDGTNTYVSSINTSWKK